MCGDLLIEKTAEFGEFALTNLDKNTNKADIITNDVLTYKEKILGLDKGGYKFRNNAKSSDSENDSHEGLSDEEDKEEINELNVPFDFEGSEESNGQDDVDEESCSDDEGSQNGVTQNEQETADTTPSTTTGEKDTNAAVVVTNPNLPKLLERKPRTLKRRVKELKHKVIFKQINCFKIKHKLKRIQTMSKQLKKNMDLNIEDQIQDVYETQSSDAIIPVHLLAI